MAAYFSYSDNLFDLPLPARHRFPIGKYRMVYDNLMQVAPERLKFAPPASQAELLRVHTAQWLDAVEHGRLERAQIRRLGFPWSAQLAQRARCSVGGTLAAYEWARQTGAAGHIAGGTHHAFSDRGEGFCTFNDIAVAVAHALAEGHCERVAVVDLDVHHGNGTAEIFQTDERVFTLSVHGARNYPFVKPPSTLDVGLADGTADDRYLHELERALTQVQEFAPDMLFYQAGVDCLQGDRLGRLELTHAGLVQRDEQVFRLAKATRAGLVVTLGGGYHPDIAQSVKAHTNVYLGLLRAFG